MASIDISIAVKADGVFSAIIASDFSNLNVYMQLIDENTGDLISIERPYMLDEVFT